MKFEEHKRRLMEDPEFRKAYEELEPIYEVIRKLVAYRIDKGITQERLAEKIGTKQSSISRFESSMKLPSLSFLYNVADALNLQLRMEVVPKPKSRKRKSKQTKRSDAISIGT